MRVILSVTNDLTNDQRVHKVALSLIQLGFSVELVGRLRKKSLPLQPRLYSYHRIPMWFDTGKLFYLEFTIRLFWYLLFHRADVYTANDLDTLLPNFLVARWHKSRLIYDTHEYFTEVPELANRRWTRSAWLWLERLLFPRVQYISTVNESIADIYAQKYNKEIVVIRNVPLSKTQLTPDSKASNVVIYQGNVKLGRGIELMVKSMRYLENVQLWIIGGGTDYLDTVKNLIHHEGVEDKIRFWGLIPFENLYPITCQARIGLTLEDKSGLNTELSLPNKLFDYIQAGIPVIASDLPEIRKIVDHYEIGLILKERAPKELANLIQFLFNDNAEYQRLCRNTQKAAQILNWENEQQKLEFLYCH